MKIYKNKIIVDGVESALAVATDLDVGDGALILKQDGAVIGSFTANQKNDSIINIPTNNLSNATATRSGLMSKEDKSKLDSIEKSANNYVHPKSHPATMITQDQAHKFATAEQLKKVDAIPENPKYTDTTYGLADSVNDGLMAAADKVKLDSIEEGANNYVHPKTHAAIIITQDETHRFVSDTQIANWNAKADTKVDVGLGNVTNDVQVKRNEMGAANGVATLGTDGKVPSSQLPSYVDDVLEYKGISNFPVTGESSKIYVDTNDNKTYRGSGSTYVEISTSIVVGTTTGTAFDGKIGNDHINNKSNPHGVTKSQVGLGNVGNFKAVSTVASQGLTDTEKSNARANIGAGTSSFSGSYNDLSNKPTIPTNTNQLTNGAGFITNSGTAKTISDTLPISKGGTGKTTGVDAANTLINSLSTGDSTPTDADYYISQYVGGGTTTTTYHRRPMSALWNYIKSKLAKVAISGSYNDLSNKPTIPSVGNGTITITQNGTSKGIFTTNQSGNTTIELTDNNTTYGVATTSADGLMSSEDKTKLNSLSNKILESEESQIDLIIKGETIVDEPDGSLEEITEAEIDTILNS